MPKWEYKLVDLQGKVQAVAEELNQEAELMLMDVEDASKRQEIFVELNTKFLERVHAATEEMFNAYGSDGWELAGSTEDRIVFKRQKDG